MSSSFDNKAEYVKKLLFVFDIAVVVSIYVMAIFLYPFLRVGQHLNVGYHLSFLPIIVVLFVLARSIVGEDVEIHGRSFKKNVRGLLQVVGLTLGISALLIFLLDLKEISRLIMVGFGVCTLALLLTLRRVIVWFYFLRKSRTTDHRLRVLIVGSGRRARMLGNHLEKASVWGVKILGYLDPTGESAGRRASDRILGHVDRIGEILRDNVVEDVIVAVPRSMLGSVQTIIDACQEEGVRLRFMTDIYDFEAARIRLTEVDGIPLLSFEPVAREEGALVFKRIFDFAVTFCAMPILLPVFGITAIAIKLDSTGPVLFTQERVGLHKRPFKMYKFRSMAVDAENRMSEVEHLNEASGPNFKILKDPRVTRVGRIIRKTSIDELPQLFNVILGNMSLVGPRPMSKRDVGLFDKGIQRKRFSVKPGITCLWQVSGRSDLSFDDWLELDLKYIKNWTFWLDIKILLKTIPAVVRGSGAA